MKIIDFDAKFFEFAQKWVAAHPGMTDQQVEDSYNRMMTEWVNRPADWLDGAAPAEYFRRFEDPAELIALMEGYLDAKIMLPEPLYSRIVELGEACAPGLVAILADEGRDEAIRAEAMGMLRDMDTREADKLLMDFVCEAEEQNEISELASEILADRDAETASKLLDRYPDAPEYAQTLILDVCCNFPGDPRTCEHLIHRLRNQPERRALWASCLGKLGDERALETLREMLNLFDLRYMDYIELRAAVEALGGDPGEERTFYGDPDFEALRLL